METHSNGSERIVRFVEDLAKATGKSIEETCDMLIRERKERLEMTESTLIEFEDVEMGNGDKNIYVAGLTEPDPELRRAWEKKQREGVIFYDENPNYPEAP